MRQNHHIENEDRSTVLMAEWIELNPRPNRKLNRCTITAELWLALALGMFVFLMLYASSWSYTWEESAIEDEAQTSESQGRVEL